MQVLKSELDPSVNFISEADKGFIEARYVRRARDYVIGYLSSQTGCNRGCKFCHLTTTGQTLFQNCTADDFEEQAEDILEHYSSQNEKAVRINWNYMARGEPLCNPVIEYNSQEHFQTLSKLSREHELDPHFNISTIMPKTMKRSLKEMFKYIKPNIYYSIYSSQPEFRSKWLPGALDLKEALELLKEYQSWSCKPVTFHNAFIKGENDSPSEIYAMMKLIQDYGIYGKFNIVRYNPYSPDQGKETGNYFTILQTIREFMPAKIVSRVGEDVFASCGMFIEKT